MKKVIYSCLFLAISTITFGQKDMFTAISEISEDVEFIQYVTCLPKDGGGYDISNTGKRGTLKMVKNKFDKNYGFKIIKSEDSHEYENAFIDGDRDTSDHQVLPSYIVDVHSTNAFVFLDSVLYAVKDISADGSKFKIQNIWIPTYPDYKCTAKLNMQDKLAMKICGNPFYIQQTKEDHQKKLMDYFKAMKVKQSKYAYTTVDLEETRSIYQDRVNLNAEIKEKNDAYWASPEGIAKRKRMSGNDGGTPEYTVTNTGSTPIEVFNNGVTTIQPGKSKTFWCTIDLYHPLVDGTTTKQGTLWIDGDDYCGGTVNL